MSTSFKQTILTEIWRFLAKQNLGILRKKLNKAKAFWEKEQNFVGWWGWVSCNDLLLQILSVAITEHTNAAICLQSVSLLPEETKSNSFYWFCVIALKIVFFFLRYSAWNTIRNMVHIRNMSRNLDLEGWPNSLPHLHRYCVGTAPSSLFLMKLILYWLLLYVLYV